MNREAIRTHYNEVREWLDDEVKKSLFNLLNDARKEFHRNYPDVAEPKVPEIRIKYFAKIIEKLERKNRDWSYEQVFVPNSEEKVKPIVNDLVGGKLVCATNKDVENLASILRNWTNRLFDLKEENVFNPKTGYRAYHIDALTPVHYGNDRLLFPVEIQIKTLLQDAWANFDHDELYKPADAPPEVTKAISRQIADVLSALDNIGQIIRDEKFRKLPAPERIPDEEKFVTQNTLNYLVDQIFQVTMSEFELQRCVDQLRAFNYLNIADVSALAEDPRLKNIIEVAKAQLRFSSETTPYEILYFGPLAAKEGVKGVIDEFRRVYSLTEFPCDGCKGPISEEDRDFKEKQTDLDGIYLCKKCRGGRLNKCNNCDKFTEAEVCKDCRALDSSSEII